MKKLITICLLMAAIFTATAQQRPSKEETIAFMKRTLEATIGSNARGKGIISEIKFSEDSYFFKSYVDLGGSGFTHLSTTSLINWEKIKPDFITFNDGNSTSGNTATKSIIIAQLTNNTKNKAARVTLKPDNGTETVEYVYPGSTLTKKYDTNILDIKVNYWGRNVYPNEEVLTDIKNEVRKLIINENGTFKTKNNGAIGVRG